MKSHSAEQEHMSLFG